MDTRIPTDRIEGALKGRRAALEALSAWCLERTLRLAYTDLGSMPNREMLAGEIAGAASLKAITHLDQFKFGTSFEAWLHQIVRNCVGDHFRRSHRTPSQAVYRRWVHDFLHNHGPELETLIQREGGKEGSDRPCVLFQRIATDLREKTYREFQRLAYEGRDHAVLDTVKGWLGSFVGPDCVSLYGQNEAGEWIETDLAAPEDTEAQVFQREFVRIVNGCLAKLPPLCRRVLGWHYRDRLRVHDIASLERVSEPTIYRHLHSCSETFRAHLMQDDYLVEFLRFRP